MVTWGGYFDDPASELTHSVNQINTQPYYHESGLDYFEMQAEGKAYAELRPRCFHNTDISIPEIIKNIINWDEQQALKAEKNCFLSNGKLFTCFIRSHGNGVNNTQEKWRWLVMDKFQSQNIELDFIFYSNNTQGRRDSETIMNSLVFKPLSSPLPLCASSVDWF